MKRTIVTLSLEEIRMIYLSLDQRGDNLSDETKAGKYYDLADYFRQIKQELIKEGAGL